MSDFSKHYNSLANSYDEYWLYSDDFVTNLSNKIITALDLQETDQLVDIGCGTGLYALELHKLAALINPVVCADPSTEMIRSLARWSEVIPVESDAIALLENGTNGNKFLMKEAIHHIEDKERFFRAVATVLNPDSIFIILLLPPTIDYPLFSAALRRYEELQPDYNDLINLAQKVGLQAEAWTESLELKIEKSRYLKMVSGRYMSLLSTFSDDEIKKGVEEIALSHKENILRFNDIFVFLKLTNRSTE